MFRIVHARDVDTPPRHPAARPAALGALDDLRDGEVVEVRGTIEAPSPIACFLEEKPCVVSRVQILLGWLMPVANDLFLFERAVDFTLVDETGARLPVRIRETRILLGLRSMQRPERRFLERVMALPLPPLAVPVAPQHVYASEIALRPGQRARVIGLKQRELDVARPRLEREIPVRTVLHAISAAPAP